MGNEISTFEEGDDVIIRTSDIDILRQRQIGFGGWNSEMIECILKPSKVVRNVGTQVVVRAASGNLYQFNPILLKPYCSLGQALCYEDMHRGIRLGDLEKVRQLVDLVGTNKKIKGQYPLILATACGHLNIVKFLIEKDAKLNATDNDGDTALHITIHEKGIEICRVLVDKGADTNIRNNKGLTPLMLATNNGLPEFIALLVGKSDTKLNIKDSDGDTALHLAVYRSQLQSVEKLLTMGADAKVFNDKGITAFHLAAAKGDKEIFELFLIKKSGSLIDHEDKNGNTAMHIVVIRNHVECLKILLKYKADKNILNKSHQSPLECAITNANPECVKQLVDSGVDLNSINNKGHTVLHIAMSLFIYTKMKSDRLFLEIINPVLSEVKIQKMEDMIILLVRSGAGLDIKDNRGLTPLDLCLDADLKRRLLAVSSKQNVANRNNEDRTIEELQAIIATMINQDKCLICNQRSKTTVFQCSHMACDECARQMVTCHICNGEIEQKIRVKY